MSSPPRKRRTQAGTSTSKSRYKFVLDSRSGTWVHAHEYRNSKDTKKVSPSAQENTIDRSGYVYILMNPAFPKLLKIGFTDRPNVEERIRELSAATGVPYPFVLVFCHPVQNPRAAETNIHAKFSEYRANANREFFEIESSLVIRYVLTL
jgi:hypothetical protein